MNIQKIKKYISEHKKTTWFVVVVLLIFGYYAISKYKSNANTVAKYVISDVKKGSIVSSVTGSGQVSASNEVSIKSQASGDIVSINVSVGQTVRTGDLIASIDSRSARINLENAKINLEKLKNSNSTSLLQTSNSLSKAYDSGMNTVVGTNIDFGGVISGMDDLFYSQTGYLSDAKIQSLSNATRDIRNKAGVLFDSAKNKQNSNNTLYTNTTRSSSNSDIEKLINDTYDTVKQLTESLKNARNAVDYIKNQETDKTASEATAAETNLDTWINEMNTHLSDLATAKSTIEETKNSLGNINGGSGTLDLRSQELALESAQLAYDNSFIRAPFDGTVAQLTINVGDNVSSGTTIGTFITQQKVADITLNEVDVAKIKIGDKATLTFDAIDNLSISGKVSSIDLVGTVSQGVVSYNVKIVFDTQDERIKSGMSVSAAIITNSKQDIIVAPTSAIKTQGNISYVDVVPKETKTTDSSGTTLDTTPTQQQVEIGISDDTSTEIISGLNEGDKIVTKTISGSTAKTTTAPSLFGGAGTRNVGGGSVRGTTGR